MLLVVK